VERASAERDRGFTLIELVIAVGVIAMTAAAGIGISLASRSLAVSTAATEFDQFLDSARTMSRELQGATLVFAPDAYGDGTEVRLLASTPNGTLVATTLPDLHARAIIEETESLGNPPYAFVVHATARSAVVRASRLVTVPALRSAVPRAARSISSCRLCT
jgi:prepilin-type N-terminal cleavage/methylation domain-containing protein